MEILSSEEIQVLEANEDHCLHSEISKELLSGGEVCGPLQTEEIKAMPLLA